MVLVTAGIFVDGNQVLIAQRKRMDKFGFRWEFPGGKVSEGESPEEGLKRELYEEFKVDVVVGSFLMESKHDFEEEVIELLAYWVDSFCGEFVLNSHEQIRWVPVKDLDKFDFLDADKPIVRKLMSDEDVLRSRSQTRSSY